MPSISQEYPNTIADTKSQSLWDHSDRMLCPHIFLVISKAFGPLKVNLFASGLTHQTPHFYSWSPDPLAERGAFVSAVAGAGVTINDIP